MYVKLIISCRFPPGFLVCYGALCLHDGINYECMTSWQTIPVVILAYSLWQEKCQQERLWPKKRVLHAGDKENIGGCFSETEEDTDLEQETTPAVTLQIVSLALGPSLIGPETRMRKMSGDILGR